MDGCVSGVVVIEREKLSIDCLGVQSMIEFSLN